MKKIYSIILTATALVAISPMADAQGQYSIDGIIKDPKYGTTLQWPKDNGVHVDNGASFGYSKKRRF